MGVPNLKSRNEPTPMTRVQSLTPPKLLDGADVRAHALPMAATTSPPPAQHTFQFTAEAQPTTLPIAGFYEFFAGAGMARAGLGHRWECLFANDFDQKKAATYRVNWDGDQLLCCDIRDVGPNHLPGHADLVWASFPCQDLSLAGGGAGLKGERSGTFWPFWTLMTDLADQGRASTLIVLENVCGTLTSHEGKDIASICRTLQQKEYRVGIVIVDAVHFVPQSRPRLFVVAVKNDVILPDSLVGDGPCGSHHPRTLQLAYDKLPEEIKNGWLWWRLSPPPPRTVGFADIMEEDPESVTWHTSAETNKLLAMMSQANMEKVRSAQRSGLRMVGTVYKRTRKDEAGRKVQRAEVRFDNIAGCLRTPAGGSSRQLVIVVEGKSIRSRLMSSRETARLMGLDDQYSLPRNYNEAYHLTGDGVVVPVVRHLSRSILEPVVEIASQDGLLHECNSM